MAMIKKSTLFLLLLFSPLLADAQGTIAAMPHKSSAISSVSIVALLAVAVSFIATGLIPLATSRPLIQSSKTTRLILLLAFTPLFIVQLNRFHTSAFISLAMFAYIFFMVWRQSLGYMILGISNPEFRQSLLATLKNQNLVFHEDITGITVEPQNILIETNAFPGGFSRIRFKNNTDPTFILNFVQELRKYYAANRITMTRSYCFFYLILGLLLLASFIPLLQFI